jgi:hypothetical protein
MYATNTNCPKTVAMNQKRAAAVSASDAHASAVRLRDGAESMKSADVMVCSPAVM